MNPARAVVACLLVCVAACEHRSAPPQVDHTPIPTPASAEPLVRDAHPAEAIPADGSRELKSTRAPTAERAPSPSGLKPSAAGPSPELRAQLDALTVEVAFLILGTFEDETAASEFVRRLAARDLSLDAKESRAPSNDKTCEREPRGRWDNGTYLSVECSRHFEHLRPGFFLVVAASGQSTLVEETRSRLAAEGVIGYVIREKIYMGCRQ